MSANEGHASDWVTSWIEQQRELLRRQAAAGESAAHSQQELGQRWFELSQGLFAGLMPGAPNASGAHDATADMFSAWRTFLTGAAAEGQGAQQRMAELFERLPPLGPARERTEAWRALLAAQAECRRLMQEVAAMLLRVQFDTLNLLEQRTRERADRGQAIADFRALHDLWVECGEQVYAQIAHSAAYSRLQAEYGNALTRLRARQQAILEYHLKQLDLPTRAELNTVHRQVRELRERVAQLEQQSTRKAAPRKRAASNKTASQRGGRKQR